MRFAILIVLLWPAFVVAKPRVAVAPLDGDTDGKIGALVHEAAAAHAKVTSAKTVAKTLKELKIKDPDTAHAAKQLRKRLEVDAVIYGKVERVGAKKQLKLSIYTRGKKPDRFELEYKQSSSKTFREQLRSELAERLAPKEDTQEDADEAEAAKKHANDRDDHGDEAPAIDETDRNRVTQAAAFFDVGIGGVHRALDYVVNAGGTKPPRVGTGAFAFHLAGEVYPGAFDSLKQTTAALGIFVSVDKGLGLSIAIPGATQSAPISETSYEIGARYRFVFGQSSLAVGLGFFSESFIADRSTLTSPTQLNMPDTDYKAIGPDALLRLGVAPNVGLTLQLDVPLTFSSGPITDPSYYGAASVLAFAVEVGADIALGPHYGLHFGGFYHQEGLSFQQGMLSSATDRTMGASAAFALMY